MYPYIILRKIYFSYVGNFYTRDVSLRLILTQFIRKKFKLWSYFYCSRRCGWGSHSSGIWRRVIYYKTFRKKSRALEMSGAV